jgi:hypothetical protein
MIRTNIPRLLYKATRDGFTASSFHSKCDGKANTVTIIKTSSNYVFGGFTAAMWSSPSSIIYGHDATAFIFSLRRNGISYNEKYMVKNAIHAIENHSAYGPTFGGGGYDSDIHINNNNGGLTNFGQSYNRPSGISDTSYLAGSYNSWTVSEIEVFQI